MDNISVVIFDVGGVLLDWRSSAKSLALHLGVDFEKLLSALFEVAPLMNCGKVSNVEGWRTILNSLGSSENPRTIIRQWRAEEFWFPESLKLIDELSERGYKLAIFSNSWLGLTSSSEKHTFPPQIAIFDYIFDSSNDGLTKPHIKYYKLVQKSLDIPPNRLLFIDDDGQNLEPAKKLGWNTFHFNTHQAKDAIKQTRSLLLN